MRFESLPAITAFLVFGQSASGQTLRSDLSPHAIFQSWWRSSNGRTLHLSLRRHLPVQPLPFAIPTDRRKIVYWLVRLTPRKEKHRTRLSESGKRAPSH